MSYPPRLSLLPWMKVAWDDDALIDNNRYDDYYDHGHVDEVEQYYESYYYYYCSC